uniref:N-acetyltransferase domain-containing protein n=1 Tax=Elaeophora elaphi TaxID=1147741 RepID=A0A0R3RZZ5_9BILA
MVYLMKHFIPNEPSVRSIRMCGNDGWKITADTVRKCFQFPYSHALKNENDEIVAVRLAAIIERPKLNEIKECENDEILASPKGTNEQSKSEIERLPRSAIEIRRLLCAMESKIWHLVESSTKKLLEIMVISTHEKYTGRGLMRELLTFDLTEQKRDGIQGGITEATALNSQKLFAKLGYKVLYQINYDEWLDEDGSQIFKCDDGTCCAQLAYRLY